jgi:hypothetical protein
MKLRLIPFNYNIKNIHIGNNIMDETSIIDIVCNQTTYDKEMAVTKLKEFDNDPIQVIKDFMGIKEKIQKPCPYVSQERYKIIRNELDKASINYIKEKENPM